MRVYYGFSSRYHAMCRYQVMAPTAGQFQIWILRDTGFEWVAVRPYYRARKWDSRDEAETELRKLSERFKWKGANVNEKISITESP